MATIGGFSHKHLKVSTPPRRATGLTPNPPGKYEVDGLSEMGYPLDLGLIPQDRAAKLPSEASSWKTGSSTLVDHAWSILTSAASLIGTAGLALSIAGIAAHLSNRKQS